MNIEQGILNNERKGSQLSAFSNQNEKNPELTYIIQRKKMQCMASRIGLRLPTINNQQPTVKTINMNSR